MLIEERHGKEPYLEDNLLACIFYESAIFLYCKHCCRYWNVANFLNKISIS